MLLSVVSKPVRWRVGVLLLMATALVLSEALSDSESNRPASAVVLMVAVAIGIWIAVEIRLGMSKAIERGAADFRAIAEQSPDAIIVHDRGTILYANAAAAKMRGVPSPEAFVGTEVFAMIDPVEHDAISRRQDALMASGVPTAPRLTRILQVDGTRLEVESRGAIVRYGGRTAMQVVMRDVSARRTAELALQLSEQRFRAMIHGMDEGVVLQDAELAIQQWNPAAERLLGLRTDALSGRCTFDETWRTLDEHDNLLPPSEQMAATALRTGKSESGVLGVVHDDGERRWVHVNAVPLFRPDEARPYSVVATYSDVTAARESRRALLESEERYRLLADHSGDMISVRRADDVILWASPSHTQVLGYTMEELLGERGVNLVHPDDLAKVLEGPVAELMQGVAPRPAVCRIRHRTGAWVWVEVIATPLPNTRYGAAAYLVSARDITPRLQLEEELRQSQKMEAMGRMASAMAHDVNNLLTVVRSSADLARATDDADEAASHFADLDGALARAAGLTAQLLAFGRRQHTSPRHLCVASLLEEDMGLMTRMTSPRVQLQLEVSQAAAHSYVYADRGQLEQAVFNLLVNARDASAEGANVTLRCDVAERPDELVHRFGSLAVGRYVVVTVEDHGTGIPSDAMAHLFEPFHSTKPQGKGTGLGLSTAYGIVQQAKGTITVDTEVGGGTRFSVYWPVSAPDATNLADVDPDRSRTAATVRELVAQHASHRASASAVGGARDGTGSTPAPTRATDLASSTPPDDQGAPRILLVDDDHGVRKVIARLLEHAGYVVRSFASAESAMPVLLDASQRIDALITDVRMPRMSGPDLVETMMQSGRTLPVLFVSGQLDAPLPDELADAVTPRFLHKPFTTQDLLRSVSALLRRD